MVEVIPPQSLVKYLYLSLLLALLFELALDSAHIPYDT